MEEFKQILVFLWPLDLGLNYCFWDYIKIKNGLNVVNLMLWLEYIIQLILLQ